MPFLSLPEELLQRILAHLIPQPPIGPPTYTKLAPLYVSRQLNRIATLLLYRSIHLPSLSSAHLLVQTLIKHPNLQGQVKSVTAGGLWSPVIRVLELCTKLQALDLTIVFESNPEAVALPIGIGDDVRVSDTFSNLVCMRHLTLRKRGDIALLRISPMKLYALNIAIARAIGCWPDLRTVNLAFRLADDTPISSSSHGTAFALPIVSAPPVRTGIAILASSLASAPALHTFSTYLPSVWVAAIATIATNPALRKIVLEDGLVQVMARVSAMQVRTEGRPQLMSQHQIQALHGQFASQTRARADGHSRNPFVVRAKQYPRLVELIAARTPWFVRDSPLASGASQAQATSGSSVATAPGLNSNPSPSSSLNTGAGNAATTSTSASTSS
ncbi:hypothetical protein H0H92_015150 [Tricholoma furcatifolium]|nr:hypothetical protein H0H92_015150 [Tricholoma furcatifolium]